MATASPAPGEPSLTAVGVGLRELEAFIAVAELNSFSLAAQRLHLSQPAVTARVQKLEALLGTKLLHRTTRTVEVTVAGGRLAAEAVQAMHGLRELIAEFLEEGSRTRRRVVVAATPMIAATLLPRSIQRYGERHPGVRVTMLDLRYRAALEALARGECDVAVMALDEPQPKLRFQPLVEDELVLVAPPAHPLSGAGSVTLQELALHQVMLLDQYSQFQAELEAACGKQGVRFNSGAKAGNLSTLLGMLDAGAGVTLLPRFMAQHNATDARSVVSIAGMDLRRRYGILSPKGKEMSAAVRDFCDFLRADLKPKPDRGSRASPSSGAIYRAGR